MGFLSSLTGSSGAKAAKKAAAIQTAARNEASTMLGGIIPTFQPYANLANQFLPMVQESATVEGLGSRFGDILTNPAFDVLRNERMEAAQTQLANTGLSRSGAALREVANVPTELALGLEGMLAQRQGGLFSTGLGAQGTIADIIAQQANIKAGIGDVQAQGKLGAAAARAAGAENILKLGAMAAGGYYGGITGAAGMGKAF